MYSDRANGHAWSIGAEFESKRDSVTTVGDLRIDSDPAVVDPTHQVVRCELPVRGHRIDHDVDGSNETDTRRCPPPTFRTQSELLNNHVELRLRALAYVIAPSPTRQGVDVS